MTRKSTRRSPPDNPDGSGVDWIVLGACILGCATVFAASVSAGEQGLVAHVGHFVIAHAVH